MWRHNCGYFLCRCGYEQYKTAIIAPLGIGRNYVIKMEMRVFDPDRVYVIEISMAVSIKHCLTLLFGYTNDKMYGELVLLRKHFGQACSVKRMPYWSQCTFSMNSGLSSSSSTIASSSSSSSAVMS